MTGTVRPALEADFPVLAGIWNALNPNHAASAEQFTREVREARAHPLGLHWAYWVAERAGRVVAYASVEQYAGLFHAGRYHAAVLVLPEVRGQGIGGQLAGTLAAHLRERGAREVLAGYHETDPAAPALLDRYGLREVQRYFDAHLDLTAFDFPAWAPMLAVPEGVQVVSYAALVAGWGEAAALRVFHDVYTRTVRDVPAPAERTLPSLDEFRQRLGQPLFRPEGVQLALDAQGRAVAFTEVWQAEDDPRHLAVRFTCTDRAWRGRGLALALKLRAMRDAHEQGFTRVTTNAESGNAAMLRLNARLGFLNDVAYVECRWGKV